MTNINTLLIKYEDLENDRNNTFLKIIKFANKIINNEKIIDNKKFKMAIETTNFDVLKKREEIELFEIIKSFKNKK